MTDFPFAYADESGDTGYHFASSSSLHFVLGILFPGQPEQTIDKLLELRRSLGKSSTYEFHFRQADTKTRSRFFNELKDEPIQFMVAILHKQYAPSDFRRLGKIGIYSHALTGLGLRAPFELTRCKLHLDGNGQQKKFLQTLKGNVRWACRAAGLPTQNFRDIRMLTSAHPLIQYADMMTSAVAESINQNNHQWYDHIADNIVIRWEESWQNSSEEKRNSPD